jgi:hypothetical protein
VVETVSIYPRYVSGGLCSLPGRGRRRSLFRLARSPNPPVRRGAINVTFFMGALVQAMAEK